MTQVTHRVVEYGDGEAARAAALVAGFNGRIADLEPAARTLLRHGYDVVAYEYSPDVLLAGDATLLPRLITDLTDDFIYRTAGYSALRHFGASLGGGIAWNMQKSAESLPGVYAAVGADTARLIMRNQLFRTVVRATLGSDPAKTFELRGYTETDLRDAWQALHQPPANGFRAVYGSRDYIVRYGEVAPRLREWQDRIDIRTKVIRGLGHSGVIRWFADNLPVMLREESVAP